MGVLSDLFGFAQFISGLRPFLREPVSTEQAPAYVRTQMERRPDLFLDMLAKKVFAQPDSPYRQLLAAVGCEFGDIQRQVRADGIEATLRCLLEAGVYVTYDEFKGRAAAVRGSLTFHFSDSDFDNPLLTSHFRFATGGSSGRPAPVRSNLEHLAQSAPHWALWFAAHGWGQAEVMFWTQVFAGVANRQLMCAKIGKPYIHWFTAGHGGTLRDSLTAASIHGAVRWAAGFPRPTPAPFDQPWLVGEQIARLLAKGRQPCLITSPSAAVRISLEAQARGVSLEGLACLLGSEPVTPARSRAIQASGASAVASYGFSEAGGVGCQCPQAEAADDVHIFEDAFAVIQRTRPAADEAQVKALLFTALRPACPKVLLNTEIGDAGVLTRRRCGCLFDEVGYTQRLHTVRSFEKLTGEGVTIAGADLYPILEQVLPARFGGSLADYQLIEQQDDHGLPRYALLVSPEVGPLDEPAVVAALLEALGQRQAHYRLMANLWRQTRIVEVRRQRPVPTARGKVLPFRTLSQNPKN